jgi:hypothetical protein
MSDSYGELECLERIHAEAQDAFQKIQAEQPEDDSLWAVIQRAKLNMTIARLGLKRHQRHHATGKPPGSEKPSSLDRYYKATADLIQSSTD